ncbi:MAG: cupin domain-containing protein [Betaproteobacteria bacterium]|nr:cupin domain-containing protein [Betaproteobacteria bacterium]
MRKKSSLDVIPEATLGLLLPSLAPIAPRDPAALRQQVMARVQREAAHAQLIQTIPAGDGDWAELLPKVHGKRVYTDGVAESWLIRLDAGARAPAHDHPASEECIVLQGSVRYLGGSTLNAGDYEVVQPGFHHTELVSDTGALVFLRYAAPLNQYVAI